MAMGHDEEVAFGHRKGVPDALGQRCDERDSILGGKAKWAGIRLVQSLAMKCRPYPRWSAWQEWRVITRGNCAL